jgi:hypothetical protein
MSKRILVLDKNFSPASQAQNSNHIVSCNSTDDVLPILMGGSSAFGNDNYSKTGKIRPEVLVVDHTYLSTYEGLEILEIIRKYYTLRNVSIYVAVDQNIEIDPVMFKRYKIAGILTKPYNFEIFSEPSSPPADGQWFTPREGSFMAGAFLLTRSKLKAAAVKIADLKLALLGTVKTIGTAKIATVVAGAVLTTAAIKLNVSTTKVEKEKVNVASVIPAETAPKPVTEAIASENEVIEAEEIKSEPQHKSPVTTPVPSAEIPAIAENSPPPQSEVALPKREAKIMVVADEEQ